MIICTECGVRNQDDERFCGGCGAFLEWKGATVDRQDTSTQPEQIPNAGPTPPNTTPDTTRDATRDTTPDATRDATRDTTPDATPNTRPNTPPDTLVAVQPGTAHRPRPSRPVEQVVESAPVDGIPCPTCGVGNDPARRFCRSCGAPLTVAVAPTKRRPWWRRLLDRLRRGRQQMRARRDHRAARTARRLLLLVMMLCLFAVLAVVGPPLVRRGVNEIRDRTQEHVPLTPTATAASSAGRDTPASRIADGATNRYWAPKGPAVGAWVEVSFGHPVRLLDVVITPGISTERAKFLTVGRPDEVTVVAYRAKADPVEQTVRLRDEPGPQQFQMQVTDVTRIRLVVRSTHGAGSEPAVAIGEAEFFGRT